MKRYSAMCRQKIGGGFQSFNLKEDFDTRDEAMKEALDKFGPQARDCITVYSFSISEADSKGTRK